MDCPTGRDMVLDDFTPNGLLPNKATSLTKELDKDRWSRAERRTAELLAQILPNQKSEEQRNSVVSYLRCLIMQCAPCQVFIFGSVPLKTYLPDGDIDLTAFSDNQNSKDSLIHVVRDILESEEKNENAEFHVKEVQHIQAEVTILKCLVDNFVVDISFNQLSGLCTLCFLEEVDNLIRQNHLFKRSIILVKAWCYHESRILGAQHGLISSYALETLVLYIFHIYNLNTFAGPLEVLYRFLDFFSKFDWNNYCISLWGPVPISSLPNMRAERPRKDSKELLLSDAFLIACKSFYGVKRNSPENQEQPFVSKHINIVDPLCANNNLGRSISKGNFFRIKSAIAFGAQRLMRLLDCPEDNLIAEFDYFFRNTWDRHGRGHWIDLVSYNLFAKNNHVEKSTHDESGVEHAQAFQGSHGLHLKEPKGMLGTSAVSSVSQTWSTRTSDMKHTSSMKNALTDKGKRPMYSSNEGHDMHQLPPQHKQTGVSESESGQTQIHSASLMIGNSNKGSSAKSEVLDNHNIKASAENQLSLGKNLHDWRSEDAVDSKNDFSCEFGLGENNKIGLSVDEAMRMHQEEYDFMNLIETYRNSSFKGYPQAPFTVISRNVPIPPPPPGFPPLNVPSFESSWGHHMPYSQGQVPLPASGRITEPVDYNVVAAHLDHDKSIEGLWSQQDIDGGSSSSWWTGSGSYLPKDYWETTEHKWLTRENDSDDPPPDKKITIDGDVNPTAISKYTPALPSTSRTKPSSSSFSSSLTSQPLDTDLAQSKTEIVTSDVQANQLASSMKGPIIKSNPSIPNTPVLVSPDPGPSHRAVDNKGLSSFGCGPSGPPFPATTKFPFHNLPTETGIPYTHANHMDMDLANLQACLASINLDSYENSRQSDAFLMSNHMNLNATSEPYVKQKTDNLKADFICHWLNLQYGRICEKPQLQGPLPYPPALVVPMYPPPSPAPFPWQVPRRLPDLMNTMAYGPPPPPPPPPPPLFPMMPNQYAHGFNPYFDQRYVDLASGFSGGTGTFLPDPISYQHRYYRRKCYSSFGKNQRGNCRYERRDEQGGREDNWNFNSSRGQLQLGDLMERTNQNVRRNRKRNSRNNASTSNNDSDANVQNDIDPPLLISAGTNDEASHQGESSHSVSNEQQNVERDSADPSPHQPSTPNSPGVQD